MITQFTPISIKEYIRLHMERNPRENRVLQEKAFNKALAYALSGKNAIAEMPFG